MDLSRRGHSKTCGNCYYCSVDEKYIYPFKCSLIKKRFTAEEAYGQKCEHYIDYKFDKIEVTNNGREK